MNDLQAALIVAGAAAVAGVWGYNKWQEGRQRRLAEKVFRGSQSDALFSGAPQDKAREVPDPAPRMEPVLAPEPEEDPDVAEAPLPQAPMPARWADDMVDCLVSIEFQDTVPAPSFWAAQSFLAPHLGKTLSWLGYDEAAREWHRLDASDSRRYGAICASLQLVDRRGALTDTELSVFLEGVGRIAAQFSGRAELPVAEAVSAHAHAIDDFCAGVDVQLELRVVDVTGSAFAGARIAELAAEAGLALREDGQFIAADDNGMTLFSLANIGAETFRSDSMASLATTGLTLALDVPRVANGPAAFDRLLVAAQQFTAGLGGQLADAEGKPLSTEMIGTIRDKVAELQGRMVQHQIAPGSMRALRLFS